MHFRLLAGLAGGIALLGGSAGARVCELTFSECPGMFAGKTVRVPGEMIWLNAEIPACKEYAQSSAGAGKPPSIVFIIDNSGSMNEADPEAARFKVVSRLLDDIAAFAPAAEAGIVVFTRRLSFDHRENPFFRPAFPGDPSQHDSYVPLTALNRRFADGRTGLDTLKAFLRHDARGNLEHATRLPASRDNDDMPRSNTRDGTDITLGFQAAKAAMLDSRSEREGRFFIFLSDGAPAFPDQGREAMIEAFMDGVETPATFTVFFDPHSRTPVAPATIARMTENIRNNGYSLSNPKSGHWAINLPGSQLRTLLQDQVLGSVLSIPAQPKSATLSTGDSAYPNVALVGGSFVFSKRLALNEDTTRVNLEFTYTYLDTSGGRRDSREKIAPYPLTIVRAPDIPLPEGMGAACKEQARISLFHQGSPVEGISADQVELEARLSVPDGSGCVGCGLSAVPSSTGSRDNEPLALSGGPGYLSGTFRREVGAIPAIGDGTLQHLPRDSIVLLFVSPENPLDRVRRAFPFTPAPSILHLGPRNDYARAKSAASPASPQWLLLAPAGLDAIPARASGHWRIAGGPITPADSLGYVGMEVSASRAFSVDIRVFSNLGQYVNGVAFTVGPAEFEKLDKTGVGSVRRITVLWDGRARAGGPAGTGAYVLKTSVTLLRLPGIAEDKAVRTDYRRIGVLGVR